jgi:hypothetical protein|tara:strand:+ start:158 stop:352 length:195 start_codon:yes stop_codon:yes gene_type:complete
MIIFTILGIITASTFFILILMSIIESRIKRRAKDKILWNMNNYSKRDKVVTRTGGLAHDRINEK